MSNTDEWTKLLHDHPIFSLPKEIDLFKSNPLELSMKTLPDFTTPDPQRDVSTPSGRRQVMILKDADVILAVGREVRMSSFGDLKLSRSMRKSYKTLHTPNIEFEIHQMALNPSGKLLAVAGAFQVAVVVLPRAGYNRLVPDSIDCKAVQIGQFYHASSDSAPIAKIEWHPWGEAGSTLLVMTVDGKLREYDISVDTEEPQQTLCFVPERKTRSFMADDDSEREVASFTLGKGQADWGPLTVYAVMKSGDIYSICPYMPQNASIPSAYIHSLECFISAKQEFLSQESSASSKNLSTLYDYQHKYVTALVKQLPAGTVFPAQSKSILMHPPTTIKPLPQRQGPFLLQPSPRNLDGIECGDATDITYLSFESDSEGFEDDAVDTEHLGVLLVSFQEGKVDLFLDVEKVEARWETKQNSSRDLPMLAVYETIDLGLVATLAQIPPDENREPLLDLLRGNHPVFLPDPLHEDLVYIYHAFGVHALDIGPVLQTLTMALESEDQHLLQNGLEKAATTNVQPILSTFSVEQKCSNPVIAIAIPNDVYLTYSIFILTSVMRMTSFPLNLRSEPLPPKTVDIGGTSQPGSKNAWLIPMDGIPTYVSLLGTEAYKPPAIVTSFSGLPSQPKLSGSGSKEFLLTPDTLRFIGTTVGQITTQIRELEFAYQEAITRVKIQNQELQRQSAKCKDMENVVERLKGPGRVTVDGRLSKIQDEQKNLLARLDRLLQALMKKASPELSELETKWFEELKRMKIDVLGNGRYDEDSLVARTRLLEKEYARLLPPLENLVKKEKERGKKHEESSQNLGFSQAFEYGERSNLDRTRIQEVEKQIRRLATRLDVPLGHPPASQ
ncbi:hypothetical protein M413DRAFT_441079 [Hebeloma cylindrosporum]|uniref:Uncharacterized protein n=1 Tax=Hebeloma cylindrosporum TaxID=76867 RepID=A0A0C3CQ52_HEBCY|nr:hypothetical protein M413DRAFT_441079 [Hebeloma cylindrosporum h7]